MKRFHLIVSGLVQGVGFRHNTRRKARLMNLSGYVRNLAEGGVEIEVQGTPPELERFLVWVHHGPPDAVVDSVAQTEIDAIETDTAFVIR